MSEDYAREKLSKAVHSLATSAKPIQKRLEYAFMDMHTLRTHGISDPQQQAEFTSIYEALTSDKTDDNEGHAPRTCRLLSDDDASKLATRIVELESRVTHDYIWKLEDAAQKKP